MSNLHDFLYQRVQALEAHVSSLEDELNALYSQLNDKGNESIN